jgi:FkbM family methyltransferase
MKYYAEFETDKIIRENFFSDFDYKGIMVEVGGGTPEFLSMSKHFKETGWRTIVIEPNPKFVEEHKNHNNEVYQYACSYENKKGEFTIVEQNVSAYGGIVTDHSFSSISVNKDYLDRTGFNLTDLNTKKIEVEIRRLDTILDELSVNNIDILSIDVEGWELEVMMGIDTNKINCKLIVVENFLNDSRYSDFFRGIGYTLKEQINYNQIYIKDDVLFTI